MKSERVSLAGIAPGMRQHREDLSRIAVFPSSDAA